MGGSGTEPARNYTSFYGKRNENHEINNQIGLILTDSLRHSNVHDGQSIRATDYDTDHSLVVAKGREILAVNKQRRTDFTGKSYGETSGE